MAKRHPYEGLRQVALIAGGICIEHGNKQTKWSKSARVPYETLGRLERALATAGFDMVAARAKFVGAKSPDDEEEM